MSGNLLFEYNIAAQKCNVCNEMIDPFLYIQYTHICKVKLEYHFGT